MKDFKLNSNEGMEAIILGMALVSPKVLSDLDIEEFSNDAILRIIEDIKHCGSTGTRPVSVFSYLCSIGADRAEVDPLGYKDLPHAVVQLWRRARKSKKIHEATNGLVIAWDRNNTKRMSASLSKLSECHERLRAIIDETPLKSAEKNATEEKDSAEKQGDVS